MRITQIMLSRSFGGAERSFVDTALALARRGHVVQAICSHSFSHKYLLGNKNNLSLETVHCGGEWDFIAPLCIAGLINDFRSEIVHTQLKRAAWHGGRGARMAGVPVVSKLHNYVTLSRYKYVHTLIATTQDQLDYVVGKNWPADRVVVIPNFSRVVPVYEVRALPEGPVRLLSYGRHVPKKGFRILLESLRLLLDRGVDIRLSLGGEGPETDRLRKLCSKLQLNSAVIFTEWIDDVPAALDCADLFVLPSLDEPFGIVMLEAMARGVPIVTTRTQGPSQVLSEETAFFSDADSAMKLAQSLQDAILNPEQTRKKAKASLELYRTCYYEDAVIPKLEDLYRNVKPALSTSS